MFTRSSGWIPSVISEDGDLKLMLGAGADASHQPRTFTFPIGEAHLAVIREDLPRHLLLWSAVLPLRMRRTRTARVPGYRVSPSSSAHAEGGATLDSGASVRRSNP